MSADTILRELLDCGIEPGLTPDETGIEVPAGRLSDSQRAAIRQHKSELIDRLRETARVTVALVEAASRACDAWGDSEEAREQMRLQCLETPPHLRAELLEYFRRTYPRGQR